jgi:hypothetical protein
VEIKTELDMIELCSHLNEIPLAYEISCSDNIPIDVVKSIESINKDLIRRGLLKQGSHLQQGISEIYIWKSSENQDKTLKIQEIPLIYPTTEVISSHPGLIGTSTGNLSNCYDKKRELFLFHMRGSDVSKPYYFQAGAAGMGRFRENPGITARRELAEEAGLMYPKSLFGGRPIDCLAFMKDGKIPQILFSFGFADDLSGFRVCNNLDDVLEFESVVKQGLSLNATSQRESYHFTVPYSEVENIAGELERRKRFYGPIYQSTLDFMRHLRNSKNH